MITRYKVYIYMNHVCPKLLSHCGARLHAMR